MRCALPPPQDRPRAAAQPCVLCPNSPCSPARIWAVAKTPAAWPAFLPVPWAAPAGPGPHRLARIQCSSPRTVGVSHLASATLGGLCKKLRRGLVPAQGTWSREFPGPSGAALLAFLSPAIMSPLTWGEGRSWASGVLLDLGALDRPQSLSREAPTGHLALLGCRGLPASGCGRHLGAACVFVRRRGGKRALECALPSRHPASSVRGSGERATALAWGGRAAPRGAAGHRDAATLRKRGCEGSGAEDTPQGHPEARRPQLGCMSPAFAVPLSFSPWSSRSVTVLPGTFHVS